MIDYLHPFYRKYATAFGVDSFGAFCELWPKVCALLNAPARVEFMFFDCDDWELVQWEEVDTVKQCIDFCAEAKILADNVVLRRRVVLLDGTVIREWEAS